MITFDYQNALDFIGGEEAVARMEPQVKAASDMLHKKNGPGNDFLGWLDLPTNYDKEEFARIRKAAQKIRRDSDVLIVIGIGGSYLGARAVIELLGHSFANAASKKVRKSPLILFCGNSISATYLADMMDIIEGKDISLNIISKSGTTTEPAIAFRILRAYMENKYGKQGAKERIYATTDKARGALKGLADKEGYESFVVPDDVGGRFSAFDDHALFTLIWAGMSKENMISMLQAAQDMSEQSLSSDLEINDALKEGIFWADAKLNGIEASVHQYMGSMFENTVYWHAQMQNESVFSY